MNRCYDKVKNFIIIYRSWYLSSYTHCSDQQKFLTGVPLTLDEGLAVGVYTFDVLDNLQDFGTKDVLFNLDDILLGGQTRVTARVIVGS